MPIKEYDGIEYKDIPVDRDWREPRHCDKCGNEYVPTKSEQRYCPSCIKNEKMHRPVSPRYVKGKVWHKVCPECGMEFDTLRQYQIYDKKQCRYRVNSRRKYRRDKLVHKSRSDRHAERRRRNGEAWRQRMHDEGWCTRCGGPKLPGNNNALCDECRKVTGRNI